MAITLVGQGYESIEGQYDYKIGTGTMYSGKRQPMNIGKFNDNFKDRKLKCFNCNKYAYMAKEYWKKKEKETWKYFKYNKEKYIAKDCKGKQSMKKQKIQKKSDDKDEKEKDKK